MILMAATIILTTVTTIPTIPTIVSIIISFTFRKFSILSPPKIPEVLKMITIHTLYKFRIHLQLLSVNCNNDAHKMPKAGIWALARHHAASAWCGRNHIHNVLILAKGEPLTVQGNTYIHYRELQRTSRSFSIKQANEIVFITLLPPPLQILSGAGET